jgi:cation diffusion facilitator CzcD-associated flavoprotein CzcO
MNVYTVNRASMRPAPAPDDPARTDFDVLIVGAGISGIDAAYHLVQQRPGTTFALLDRQSDIGGTWKTHIFPGIRSDSDLYTFGFSWKPWTGVEIATAEEILKYLHEAVDDLALRPHIRHRRSVKAASWDSGAARWTVEVENLETGATETLTCGFLWMCQGYYRHETPYTPEWPGMDKFKGTIVHPQTWPEDLDYAGKRVIVIGSGATAATIIPALAETAAHVTMLQRSPTYFYPSPRENELAALLRPLNLPDEWFHEIMRRKVLHDQGETVRRSKEEPDALAEELIGAARMLLGDTVPVDPHFLPRYRVWRQRLARIPEGDMFRAMREGRASVVTDTIETFTETGIRTASGEDLEADIIVTATGFQMCVMGDVAFTVDGAPVDWPATVTYRGIMFSGVPNMAWIFGYLRTSWTMRADLVCDWVCRLLAHMEEKGARMVVPELGEAEADMPRRTFIDPDDFNAGYVMRAIDIMPKQGDRDPWIASQDYYRDKDVLPEARLDDGALHYR